MVTAILVQWSRPVTINTDTAVEVARRYGQIDGAHHKTWVIDQMLRHLLGPVGYTSFVRDYSEDWKVRVGRRSPPVKLTARD